jgi:phage baseplate assembly protein W
MVATDITSLPNRFFQPALSAQVAGHASGLASDRLGEVVTDADDVDQCIRVILTTPRGSDPHRPLFGSNLHLYIDYPVNSARPHIVREAVNALREWEPRIEVVKVSVTLAEVAMLACVVEWKFAAGVAAESFVTNLALGVAK